MPFSATDAPEDFSGYYFLLLVAFVVMILLTVSYHRAEKRRDYRASTQTYVSAVIVSGVCAIMSILLALGLSVTDSVASPLPALILGVLATINCVRLYRG